MYSARFSNARVFLQLVRPRHAVRGIRGQTQCRPCMAFFTVILFTSCTRKKRLAAHTHQGLADRHVHLWSGYSTVPRMLLQFSIAQLCAAATLLQLLVASIRCRPSCAVPWRLTCRAWLRCCRIVFAQFATVSASDTFSLMWSDTMSTATFLHRSARCASLKERLLHGVVCCNT